MKYALIPAALAALALSIPATLTAQEVQKPAAGKPAAGKPAGGMMDMDKHMTQMQENMKTMRGMGGGMMMGMMGGGQKGSPMMGGHSHGGHGDAATGGDVKDPVRGMTVDPKSAAAAARADPGNNQWRHL